MTLLFDSSTHRLEISDAVHTAAWQHQARIPGDRWQVYLNQVCLETVLPWLREKYRDEVMLAPPIAQPALWEIANGSVLTLGAIRLVLIPSEAIDRLAFQVPQEWIDIPSWVGDYYLAIEVDSEEREVEIWGFTTHQQLKAAGECDLEDRSYCLNSSELITDLNVLWTMYELASEVTRTAVQELPQLTQIQAENLIARLSSDAVAVPRWEIPFSTWGALIARSEWRQQLCQARQAAAQSTAVNLSRWLQNQFEAGWQAIESVIDAPTLAFSLRQESETAAVRRIKQFVLSPEVTVFMLVWFTPDPNDQIAVRVRILSEVNGAVLPAGLSLSLLSATGEVLQSVQARQQDNSIQLRRFRCPAGMTFRLQVELTDGGGIVSEEFIVE